MVDRTLEAGELARAEHQLRQRRPVRPGGRIPFDVTPGGHRRFNVDEVRLALATAASRASHVFPVPAATLRARAIRSVTTARPGASRIAPAATGATAAEELLSSAWRVQRSVPLVSA